RAGRPRQRAAGALAALRRGRCRAHRLDRQRRTAVQPGDRRVEHAGVGALPRGHARHADHRADGGAGCGLPLHRHAQWRDRAALVSARRAQRLPRRRRRDGRVHAARRPAQADHADLQRPGADAGGPGVRQGRVPARRARLPPDHDRLGQGGHRPRGGSPGEGQGAVIVHRRAIAVALLAALVAAGGCNREQRRAEEAAARAAAIEAEAEKGEAAFEAALAEQNWALAKAQGDVLLANYPTSEAAARVEPKHAEVVAKAEAQREQQRLAALWLYQSQAVGKREQRTALVQSKEPVDVGAGAPERVKLIFRDHPEWGRSSYLVLQGGDFDCYGSCKVEVVVDGKARSMAAYRPKTDEAIAMFIKDEAALWRMAGNAEVLSVEFPVKAGGTRTATFEVAGLDPARMPW